MSVPRGKTIASDASLARVKFQDSSVDVRSFYSLRQMLKGRKAAGKHLDNIARGTFVLISALWEAYCEDLARESAVILVNNAESWEDLPKALARRIAQELKGEAHELSPWKLAGDGWKELALRRVKLIARETIFNTPKPGPVDELFNRSIGLPDLSLSWSYPESKADQNIREDLRQFVELRGAIAHGASPRRTISKLLVSEFYQTVSALVQTTDETIGKYLEERTGKYPWTGDLRLVEEQRTSAPTA